MPGSAMREILKHSQHPQNLEQILLTLRRPANSITRRKFAEVGGELILIQKVTSTDPVVSDFKVANFGQVMDLPEGMLYPSQSHTTLFETWLRVEMLDALRMMIEENLVRSLLPEMQLKLISDMLQVRYVSGCVMAASQVKCAGWVHAVRPGLENGLWVHHWAHVFAVVAAHA